MASTFYQTLTLASFGTSIISPPASGIGVVTNIAAEYAVNLAMNNSLSVVVAHGFQGANNRPPFFPVPAGGLKIINTQNGSANNVVLQGTILDAVADGGTIVSNGVSIAYNTPYDVGPAAGKSWLVCALGSGRGVGSTATATQSRVYILNPTTLAKACVLDGNLVGDNTGVGPSLSHPFWLFSDWPWNKLRFINDFDTTQPGLGGYIALEYDNTNPLVVEEKANHFFFDNNLVAGASVDIRPDAGDMFSLDLLGHGLYNTSTGVIPDYQIVDGAGVVTPLYSNSISAGMAPVKITKGFRPHLYNDNYFRLKNPNSTLACQIYVQCTRDKI